MLDALVFYISALLAVASSAIVVTRKNPVYSAVFMVTFFILMALNFLILRAAFLAVIQLLVYAGAIMVLYLFVIMLLNLKPEEIHEEVSVPRKGFAFLASLGLFLFLAWTVRSSEKIRQAPFLNAEVPEPMESTGNVDSMAAELFKNHGLAFELTSVLILIAIIGAIYLTKKTPLKNPVPGDAASPESPPSGSPLQVEEAGS